MSKPSNLLFDRTASDPSRAVQEQEHGPRRFLAGDQQGR